MDIQLLKDLARYQAWADAQHWNALRENPALLENQELRQRLNHMVMATGMLAGMACGERPDPARITPGESADELESAMTGANSKLLRALETADLDKTITFPFGPNVSFDASAGEALLQALLHSHHHRAQNASDIRAAGVVPPMTDFIVWHALGRP